MFYYPHSSGTIFGYDPDLPVSGTNPVSTGIPNPPGAGLTFMPSVSGGTFSPTFYCVNNLIYYYWNGAAWTSTGHSVPIGAANIAGCGSNIYSFAPPHVFTYNGFSNATLITSVTTSGVIYDLVVDCECNFYILNLTSPNQNILKYSSTGVLLSTYSITGVPNSSASHGMAMMGNDIYFPIGTTWYKGTITTSTIIPFATTTISLQGNIANDYASCPNSAPVASINGSLSVTGNLCPGQPVSVAATTTVSLVTYSWSGPGIVGPASNSVISANASGVYTCVISRTTCPVAQNTLTITVTNGPCFSVSSNSITCASLGSATVMSTSGTGPFSYTWMPGGQTNSVATGLSPGTYTIQVFDPGNNYTYSTTTVFTSLIPLTGTLNNTSSLTCPGATNGTANVTNLAGGSGTVHYVWTNAVNSYTVPAPQNLNAGQWSVTVTDALTACQVHSVFTISQPPALTLNIAANTPSICLGGSIVVTGTASGGTPGFGYNWSNGPPSNTFTVTEISAGPFIYTLNAVDAYSCTVSNTITVDFVPNPAISIPTASVCLLETATLTASGAASYTWQGNVNGATYTTSTLAIGMYPFQVTGSALGCTNSATGFVFVKPPPIALLTSNSPVCEGGQLLLQGLAGPAYLWSGPQNFTSTVSNPVISGALPAHSGIYSATLTGVNGCTATASTPVLTVHPTPTLSATGATLCSSQTLALIAASAPGASFLWKGPLSYSSTTQNPIISQPPVAASGGYTVTATSPESCTNQAVAHVSVVPPPSLTIALSSPSLCAQAFNGSPNTITLTSSGADTYTLVTSSPLVATDVNSATSSVTTNPPYQPTGLSTATLYGSNGICTVSLTTTFSIISNPTISINSHTPVICAGQDFTYTSQGANSYIWTSTTPNFTTYSNGGAAVADPSIHSVFSVYGSSLGCNSALKTSTITVNPLPSLSVTASQSAVCRFSQATLLAEGNATSFDWFPQLSIDASSANSATVTIASDQTYTVTGAALGCTTSAVASIKVLDLPVPDISQSKSAYCIGEAFTLTGSGGVVYQWSGPNDFYRDGKTLSLTLENAGMAGLYTVTVTDQNGCKTNAVEEVVAIPSPLAEITGAKSGCAPWCGEFEVLGDGITSTWHAGSQPVLQSNNWFKLCFSKSGEYFIKGAFTDTLTQCKATQTFVVNVYEKPAADFTWLPEKPVAGIDQVLLLNNSTGKEQNQWRWYMQHDHSFRPVTENAEYFFANEGTYPIVFVVNNKWNCSDTVIKVLDIEADFAFYMPNAFTPNADSRNETFKPIVRGIKKYSFQVFDRWGERLFLTEDPEAGWDGYRHGEPCKQDSYVWKVTVSTTSGEQRVYNGAVVLIR